MTADSTLKPRAEIAFFLERAFQISLGYVAVVVAFVALVGSQAGQRIADEVGLSGTAAVGLAVMMLNLPYLVVACACLFAILKRGLFLLERGSVDSDWERFTRTPLRSMGFGDWTWNIDNYYIGPVFLALFAGSALGAVFVQTENSPVWARVLGGTLIAAHAIPIVMLLNVRKLEVACRKAGRTSGSRVP